jgi:hypothetical protein
VYHHYELNDDFVVDENVAVEINDLKVMDDEQQDDLNTMDALVVVIVVESVLAEVVKVVEDDDDEDDDEMDDQDDEVIQEVSIGKLLSLMNNVMLIEAKCK